MEAVAEGEPEGELVSATEVELADECQVAVFGDVERAIVAWMNGAVSKAG